MDRDSEDLASVLRMSNINPQGFIVSPSGNGDPVYGGLLMGRAITAAASGVGDRQCHSLQASFIRRAQPNVAMQFTVTEAMSGRNFTMRHVTATQGGQEIFSANLSFRQQRSGIEHQLPVTNAGLLPDYHVQGGPQRPPPAGIEARWNTNINRDGVREVWMRSINPIGNNMALQTAAIVYASDYPILEVGISRHGLGRSSPDLFTTSLNHSTWFLRVSDFRNWHLFRIDSPAASGGTALGHATCFDQDGTLIAIFVQEAVVWTN